MRQIEISRFDVSERKISHVKDWVAQERPLHIFLDRTHYATILCSPSNLKEMTVGHLFSEGLLKSMEEIDEITQEDDLCRVKLASRINLHRRLQASRRFRRAVFSFCRREKLSTPLYNLHKIRSHLTFKAQTVLDCINRLNDEADVFRKTGGVHAAAIQKADGVSVAFAEDVSRHNAVDKVIGIAIVRKAHLPECFLTLTGRLTGDIVIKALNAKLPMVASISAAVDSGVILARKTNLTLIGFVRGKHMNVYSAPERILL